MIDVYLRANDESTKWQLACLKNTKEVNSLYDELKFYGVHVQGELYRKIQLQYCLDDDDAYVEFVVMVES